MKAKDVPKGGVYLSPNRVELVGDKYCYTVYPDGYFAVYDRQYTGENPVKKPDLYLPMEAWSHECI